MAVGIDGIEGVDERTHPGARDASVATWVRVCRWGAVAVAAALVVLQVVIGALVPAMAVPAVIFGVLAGALRTERRRLALLTGVLAALATLGNLPGTIDALAHPSSGVAFAGGLWVLLAAVVTTVGGVAAFARWGTSAVGPLLLGAGGLMVLGAVVAGVATASVDSTRPLAGDVEVVAELNEFRPGVVEVPGGETGFWLDNRDGIRHTLTIDTTGDELAAPAYSAQRAVFDLEPGTYVLTCTVPGHEAMRVDLTVTG